MTNALEHIARQSSRSVWVFQLDAPEEALEAWEKPASARGNGKPPVWPLRDALGVEGLDPDKLEVFPVTRIGDYGLARYLTEANGFPDDAVNADAAKLSAITGNVVLVYSEALGEDAVRLRPRAPLAFIARYDTRPDLRMSAPIHTESATGQLSHDTPSSPPFRMPIWPLALFVGLAIGLIAILAIPKM